MAAAGTFNITSVTVAEGSGGGTRIATVTVSHVGGIDPGSVTVQVAGGTATPGVDYVQPADAFVGLAPNTSQTFDVTINSDNVVEADETIFVNLINAGIGTTIGVGVGVITILNDDAGGAGVVAPTNGDDYAINTTEGGDTIRALTGDDYMDGGFGADSLQGNQGNDSLYGAFQNDTLFGGAGDDKLFGGEDDDSLSGDMGADTVRGGTGEDRAFGGEGGDYLYGEAGADQLYGNTGQDMLFGGEGGDTLWGGKDNDTIYGEGGNDRISGDLGADQLFGGAGADTFVYRRGFGSDWIDGFSFAEGDRIELAAGTTYAISTYQGQTVLDFGGGDTLGFASPLSAFNASWIVFV